MNLIIDQGNTAVKVAIFEDENLLDKGVFLRDKMDNIQEWIVKNKYFVIKPVNVLISSVTNDEVNLSALKIDLLLKLDTTTDLPIKVRYESPETLGNDRLANAVAAWKMNPNQNSLVIDTGTCIKYDLVEAGGSYLGGNISPGLRMRYRSLNNQTDKLPLIEPEKLTDIFGKDTKSSILHGVQQGMMHEIIGFIDRYAKEFSQLTIFMTGGDAKYFDKEIKNTIFADSDLTLKGLNEILIYNVQHKKGA